jgi:hypothetical protein
MLLQLPLLNIRCQPREKIWRWTPQAVTPQGHMALSLAPVLALVENIPCASRNLHPAFPALFPVASFAAPSHAPTLRDAAASSTEAQAA